MAEALPESSAGAKRPSRFAPVVLTGLASAAVTAVASSKSWFEAAIDLKQLPGVRELDTRADMPLALALSLVVLAAWGVVLVSRTTGRRIVLALAGLAGAGIVACVITAPLTLPDQVREQLGSDGDGITVSPTGWYVVAAVAATIGLACVVVGWVLAPRWPTMSSRYDAPTGGTAAGSRTAPQDDTDLWKALDAGVDPTDPAATEVRRAP